MAYNRKMHPCFTCAAYNQHIDGFCPGCTKPAEWADDIENTNPLPCKPCESTPELEDMPTENTPSKWSVLPDARYAGEDGYHHDYDHDWEREYGSVSDIRWF